MMVQMTLHLLVLLVACAILISAKIPEGFEGGVQAAVVGGVGVPNQASRFPWYVRLPWGCGGSLVSPNVVLTAAHCTGSMYEMTGQTDPMQAHIGREVVIGPSMLSGKGDALGGERRVITRILRPPEYKVTRATGSVETGSILDDMSLLILDRPSTKLPIVLAPTPPKPNEIVTFIGHGGSEEGNFSQRIKRGQGRVASRGECVPTWAPPIVRTMAAHPSSICVRPIEGRPSVWCGGDSGGPVFINRDNPRQDQLIGCVSGGSCGKFGLTNVHKDVSLATSVAYNMAWIRQVIKQYAK